MMYVQMYRRIEISHMRRETSVQISSYAVVLEQICTIVILSNLALSLAYPYSILVF